MKHILFLLTLCLFTSCAVTEIITPKNTHVAKTISTNHPVSIIQGVTTEEETVLRLIYPHALTPEFIVTDSKGLPVGKLKTKHYRRKYSPFVVTHLRISDLKPNTEYNFEFKTDHVFWKDIRKFKTLDNTKEQYKIIISSCLSDAFVHKGNKLWKEAFAKKPDANFLIGDNIYADVLSGAYVGDFYVVSPRQIWERYIDHAMSISFNHNMMLTPTYVTWDDHDYGKNDAGKTHIYKKQAQNLLEIFFPRFETKSFKKSYGVSSHLQMYGHNFYFLDGRSFRDEGYVEKGEHLGAKQTKWLFKNLRSNNQPSWLILGDQFLGAYHKKDSFEGHHPNKFKELMGVLDSLEHTPVLISGDRHYVEAQRTKSGDFNKIYTEFTISGAHSTTRPGYLAETKNPRMIGGYDKGLSYGLLTIKKDSPDYVMQAFTVNNLKVMEIKR